MSPATEPPGTLLATTLALLRQDERSCLDLHKATGLPFYWLRKFGQGRMPNPSVNKVQKLYEYLTQSKLTVVK